MKFEKISIRNFRNFENIEIAISNKNIFFGLNDIGKTNFLYAMRYVFDNRGDESGNCRTETAEGGECAVTTGAGEG